MGVFCITDTQKKSAQYKAAMEKFNLSSNELHGLLYDYYNSSEGEKAIEDFNNKKQKGEGFPFPSDSYLQEHIYGPAGTVTEPKALEIYDKHFSKPLIYNTRDEALVAVGEATKYFDQKSVVVRETADGKFQMLVTRPIYDNSAEIDKILRSAKRDSEGNLLAPNGEKSKLTEYQYAQVRTKAFMDWFGDWINDPENASKVVDPVTKEPMVVYHGGAKDIYEFKSSEKGRSTTGYGYYTEEGTGRQISVDSNRTIFFSDNWGVARSYAITHAITQVVDLYNKVDSLIETTAEGKLGVSKEAFNNDIENFFKTLKELAIYNPRYNKFLEYINSIRDRGEKISATLTSKEVNAFREMLIETRKVLAKDGEHWNLVVSDWENVYNNAEAIEREYNNDEGIARLQKGEVPKSVLKEWALYKKKEANREKEGKSPVSNYETVNQYLGTANHLFVSFNYDGKDLYLGGIDSGYNSICGKVTELSKEEIKSLFAEGQRLREAHLADLHKDSHISRLESRSQVYSVFLNVRNPFRHDYEGTEQGQGYKESKKYPFGYIAARQVDKAIREGYDGVVYENLYDPFLADNYGVFNPNQIKSAEKNIGTFSTASDNIYLNKTIDLINIVKNIDWTEGDEFVIKGTHNLLYKERGSYYITLGSFYNDKSGAIDFPRVLAHIASYLTNAGINPNAIKLTLEPTRHRILVESNDDISKNERKLISTKSIETTLAFLESKIPGLSHRVVRDNVVTQKKYGIGANVNAFFKDGIVYLVEGRFNEDIAIEECLHPLVNALAKQNSELFDQLVKEAQETFPTLYQEIQKSYDKESVAKELVTQALSRHTRKEIHVQNGVRSKWEQLKDKFYNFIKDLFGIIQIQNIAHTTTFAELSKIILSEDGVFDISLEGTEFNKTEKADKSENEQFFDDQTKLSNQLDEIYGVEGLFTAAECDQIANDIVYKISDIITEVEKNPEAATKYNPKANPKDFKGINRATILARLGQQNVLEYIRDTYFDASNNENIDFEDLDKVDAIHENIDAFLAKGAALFTQIELFKLDGELVSEDVDTEVGEVDINDDSDAQEEELGHQTDEAYGKDRRTENAWDKASVMVRQAFTQCYQLNPDGTPVIDKWGIRQRVNGRDAMQSVIRWTQGALTLSQMIIKLEAQTTKNPWIQPIIDRLKDTSGKESTFQSQFFGAVSKYFQLYSIGKKENGTYSVFEVNTHPALTEAKRGISGLYNAGAHPLFDSQGRVNTTSLEQLKSLWESLKDKKYTKDTAEELSETLSAVFQLLGYPTSAEAIQEVLDAKSFTKMTTQSLQFIVKALEENVSNPSWQPFSGKRDANGIINNIGKFITPITDQMEDVMNSSFYDSGNMYQSYVAPSYITKLLRKFNSSTQEDYETFMQDEYGKYRQFKDVKGNWRNSWLEIMGSLQGAREVLTHKVQLNFDGNRYMKGKAGNKAMSEAELTLSIISEYFKENGHNSKSELATAWYRIPLMSNKPSSEFIKFYSYRGADYKTRVVNGCMQLFGQELDRIQTVKARAKVFDKADPEMIANLDGERGRQFCFFDFLNSNKEFMALVDKVTDGNATDAEKEELSRQARTLIREGIQKEFDTQIETWRRNGVVDAAKTIQGVDKELVESDLENFFWNDFLASNNILNLTVTDLAYYKNTEDVQKRLAQLHAPGIRANVEARDFNGNRVADSKTRTVYLRDVEINPETLKSNIIENVKVVFANKLATMQKGTPQYNAAKASYDNIVKQFEKGINVADAQGYTSPTAYRKKALLFGKWGTHEEEIYQKLMSDDYTYTDLEIAFQPLKPFVYTQIEKDTQVESASLPSFKMGVQNKNSEYLLIMAGAITQNEETGAPNYLRAIWKVMEDSHKGVDGDGNSIIRPDGIDTIQFESTVKTGRTGRINLLEATTTEDARELLEDAIYQTEELTKEQLDAMSAEEYSKWREEQIGKHVYNKTFVQELNMEDYCIQQEVPEHYRDHAQQEGSQIRMIIPSDLNPNKTYRYNGEDHTADEFRKEYERVHAANIELALQELRKEFFLDDHDDPRNKNIALARVLQEEILSSSRYGIDMLMACMLDENAEFKLPLGDAVQSKRIEQMLNSIIKNRVNKQRIAGGPIVQVSNFGTSRQLNIRFKGKDGSVLETLNDYLAKGKSEQEWVDYIKENQAGIAYYECFAPASSRELFRDFMDKDGNIDIEAIEATNPELLKLIGYRIPTEDKYSMAPIKIVGFMPKEAGDGIMLPYEITLITGSDRNHIVVSTSII